MPYEERTYRRHTATSGLVSFSATIAESDLYISAPRYLRGQATAALRTCRARIQERIAAQPAFESSLQPLPIDPAQNPGILFDMLAAAAAAEVGPMAAVAGAVAAAVGASLLKCCDEVIVENGGDIFACTRSAITVGVFAGESPFSNRIGLRIPVDDMPLGVCTSSGRVGPSLSFGSADAVTILSPSAALADAVATAVGNMVHGSGDIEPALERALAIPGITGALIIDGSRLGARGAIELVHL